MKVPPLAKQLSARQAREAVDECFGTGPASSRFWGHEATNPMSPQGMAQSEMMEAAVQEPISPNRVRALKNGEVVLQTMREKHERRAHPCWWMLRVFMSILLLATALKVWYPYKAPSSKQISHTQSVIGLEGTDNGTQAPSRNDGLNTFEHTQQNSAPAFPTENQLGLLNARMKLQNERIQALQAQVKQQNMTIAQLTALSAINLQNERIQALQAQMLHQNETITELTSRTVPHDYPTPVSGPPGHNGSAGPRGEQGVCVGVLGGSRLWVGGSPQTGSYCGGGWTKCRYKHAGQLIYSGIASMSAKVGDVLVFGHKMNTNTHDLWRLPDNNATAFDTCDFSNATMLSDGTSSIRMRKGSDYSFREPYELPLGPADVGDLFFAARSEGKSVLSRVPCRDYGLRVHVQVAPLQEVLIASSTTEDLAKNSDTVQHLEGVVQAMARLNVLQQVGMEQRVRSEGGSGLTRIRGYETGLSAYNDASYSRNAIMNIHNHANDRDTLGMGELQAVLNGVEFQTRHNDYKLAQHQANASHQGDYSSLVEIRNEKGVPPAVLAKGSVHEQVIEMREWFRAWRQQNWTLRDYRPYFRANLCVLEGTWITDNGDLSDPFASDRHQIDAATWAELHDKIRYLFNSGRKHNLENLAHLPQAVRAMINGTVPMLANWEYRIFCHPVDGDVPTQRFRVAQDLAPQLFKRPTTKAEIFWERRARFEVNPLMGPSFVSGSGSSPTEPYQPAVPGEKLEWAESPTAWNFLDWLMEQVPGKDGPGANLTDRWDASVSTHYVRTEETLNVAYYSRYYNVDTADAMGLNKRRRGFNDGFMWAAKTEKHPQVSRLRAWDEKEGIFQESAWSYAIPLEVVYTTPLSSWNPFDLVSLADEKECEGGIKCCDGDACSKDDKPATRPDGSVNVEPAYTVKQLIQGKDALDNGKTSALRTGKPVVNPSTGLAECDPATALAAMSIQSFFYTTPASFYGDDDGSGAADAADTSAGATCVLDRNGVPRSVMAAGTWIVLPSIGGGVGKVRTRYPIVPLHVHGSTEWKELKALEDLVLPANYEEPTGDSRLFGDARDSVYGFDITLDGGGHSHNVKVSPGRVRKWATKLAEGKPDFEVTMTSELRNGHEHTIKVRRNRTSSAEPWRYYLSACQFKGASTWDSNGMCADGHAIVSRISYVAN